MKLPTLLAAAGLLALAAIGQSQTPTTPAPTPADPAQYVPPGVKKEEPRAPTPDLPGPNNLPPASVYQPIANPAVPPQPPEQTVDQVIDALEKIKAQKAELEKKEQALLDVLNKKLAKQAERLKNVGWKKEAVPVSGPKQMPDNVLPAIQPGSFPESAPVADTTPKRVKDERKEEPKKE